MKHSLLSGAEIRHTVTAGHNLPGVASQFATQNPGFATQNLGFAIHDCISIAKDV